VLWAITSYLEKSSSTAVRVTDWKFWYWINQCKGSNEDFHTFEEISTSRSQTLITIVSFHVFQKISLRKDKVCARTNYFNWTLYQERSYYQWKLLDISVIKKKNSVKIAWHLYQIHPLKKPYISSPRQVKYLPTWRLSFYENEHTIGIKEDEEYSYQKEIQLLLKNKIVQVAFEQRLQ